jgi:hypothetical protein
METFLYQAWREKSLVLLMADAVPQTERRMHDVSETWWAREACPRIAIPMTYFVQPTQKQPLAFKDNFSNCPAERGRRRSMTEMRQPPELEARRLLRRG